MALSLVYFLPLLEIVYGYFMKRVLLVFAILLVSLVPVFSIGSSFDIGVNVSYNAGDDILDESEIPGDFTMEKLALGLELRANISNFQMSLNGDLTILDPESLLFSGIFGGGFCVDMFKYLKLSATVGPKVNYVYMGDVKSVDDQGKLVNGKNFFKALSEGAFHYRFMVDFLAGPVITMGLAYTIPTCFSVKQGNYSDLIPHREDFKNGQVSLCMQMKLF